MDSARGDGLSEAERASQGFVQGTMGLETLAALQDGTGIFVAVEDDVIAGFAVTCEPEGTTNAAARAAVATVASESQDPGLRLLLYGPTVVDPRFRGRGILSRLLTGLSSALTERFDLGVAMVDSGNAKSLAVHEHYGMARTAPYVAGEREYVAFSFSLEEMAARGAR